MAGFSFFLEALVCHLSLHQTAPNNQNFWGDPATGASACFCEFPLQELSWALVVSEAPVFPTAGRERGPFGIFQGAPFFTRPPRRGSYVA